MEPVLRARELSCERGGLTLFEKLDLDICRGDLVQLVGPNGSGKTTLMRMLTGLTPTLSGSITAVDSLHYQGHKPALKASLTALENLQWYCPGSSRAEIEDALSFWRLRGYEEVRCGQLSAGQQQKVALCRLKLRPSCLWLLDEPFASLDQASNRQLEQCLLEHVQQGGAVLFTSHQAFAYPERVRGLSLADFAPSREVGA